MIEAIYQYNDWANNRVLRLADGLSDEQLDCKLEMGFGTLRATLFHILAAENAWLDRWQLKPWKSFPIDPQGATLDQIAAGLKQASQQQLEIIESGRRDCWAQSIDYQDSKQNRHTSLLADMLLHVANHGVHHRAQALFFLKQLDRKVAGGLDFIFFRIAHPTTPLIAEYIEPMRHFGMEVDISEGDCTQFRSILIQDYFRYHDWATGVVLDRARDLTSEQLHRDYAMGVGSIHKTLAHLRDAELWWLSNWSESPVPFPTYTADESLDALRSNWVSVAQRRNDFVTGLDDQAANRVVIANPGRIRVPLRVVDSLVQLCCHGTHHRAQLINMLRQSGVSTPGIDYILWTRTR